MQRALSFVVSLHHSRASCAGPSHRRAMRTRRVSAHGARQNCEVTDDWGQLNLRFSPPAWGSFRPFWCGLQGANFLHHPGSFWGRFWGWNVVLFFQIFSRVEVICRRGALLNDTIRHALAVCSGVIDFSGATTCETFLHGAAARAEFISAPLWLFRLRLVRGDGRV